MQTQFVTADQVQLVINQVLIIKGQIRIPNRTISTQIFPSWTISPRIFLTPAIPHPVLSHSRHWGPGAQPRWGVWVLGASSCREFLSVLPPLPSPPPEPPPSGGQESYIGAIIIFITQIFH